MGKRFKPDSKYFTITVYAVVAFFICALLVRIIFDFSNVWNSLKVIVGVFSPFLAGIILAYLINPLYKFLDFTFFRKWLHMKKKRRLRKTISIMLAYILVLGVIVVLLAFVVPQFASSIRSLIGTVGTFSVTIQDWITEMQKRFSNLNLFFLTDSINSLVPSLLERLKSGVETLMTTAVSTSMGVISGFIKAFLAIIVSIYILADKIRLERTLRNVLYAIFKPEKAAKVAKTIRESSNIFSNFFTGKIFDSLIIGILTGICMLIFGLPYPLLISVLVGVTNIIPYFGPFIGAIPSIIIMLMTGWKEAIIFTILIIIIQQIDGNIIGPKILGDSTGLRPIWVLFAITIGTWIGGLGGMIFSVPVMAVIGHIVEEIINTRLEKKGLHEMVERDAPPTTLNYSDMVKNIFTRKKKNKPEKEKAEETDTNTQSKENETENKTDENE